MSHVIALDIGGTQMRAARFKLDNHSPEEVVRFPTQSSEGHELDRLIELVHKIWPAGGQVAAIGVAVPGPTDPFAGILIDTPNIEGWDNLPLRNYLEDRFPVPVAIGNDANMAALGEWKYGAGRGHQNVLYLTISTGIGGGVIDNNQLLLGQRGLAGEVGHIIIDPDGPVCGCGCRGHLEAIASGTGIANWVMKELERGVPSSIRTCDHISAKTIAQAACLGDPLAVRAYEQAGYWLGLALANYLHIFNPSIIILGGGVSQSLHLMLDTIWSTLRSNLMTLHYLDNLAIVRAELGDEAGLVGASVLAQSVVRS